MKSGFISLVGRPNTGKSTLVNQLMNQKVSIVTQTAQTTRNIIRGILTTDDYQLVFIDTPGIHQPKDEFGRLLNRQSFGSVEGVDLIYFVVDGSSYFGPQDQLVYDRLKDLDIPIFLVITKIDRLKKPELISKITEFTEERTFAEIIPVSALNQDNLDTLLKVSLNYLDEEGVLFFPENMVVDYQEQFMLAELIREQVLFAMKDEIPHQITCAVEHFVQHEDYVEISGLILVQKESQKPMILGKQGVMIKRIRQQAQRHMRKYLNKDVQLDLYVRVEKDWRNRSTKLESLGFENE